MKAFSPFFRSLKIFGFFFIFFLLSFSAFADSKKTSEGNAQYSTIRSYEAGDSIRISNYDIIGNNKVKISGFHKEGSEWVSGVFSKDQPFQITTDFYSGSDITENITASENGEFLRLKISPFNVHPSIGTRSVWWATWGDVEATSFTGVGNFSSIEVEKILTGQFQDLGSFNSITKRKDVYIEAKVEAVCEVPEGFSRTDDSSNQYVFQNEKILAQHSDNGDKKILSCNVNGEIEYVDFGKEYSIEYQEKLTSDGEVKKEISCIDGYEVDWKKSVVACDLGEDSEDSDTDSASNNSSCLINDNAVNSGAISGFDFELFSLGCSVQGGGSNDCSVAANVVCKPKLSCDAETEHEEDGECIDNKRTFKNTSSNTQKINSCSNKSDIKSKTNVLNVSQEWNKELQSWTGECSISSCDEFSEAQKSNGAITSCQSVVDLVALDRNDYSTNQSSPETATVGVPVEMDVEIGVNGCFGSGGDSSKWTLEEFLKKSDKKSGVQEKCSNKYPARHLVGETVKFSFEWDPDIFSLKDSHNNSFIESSWNGGWGGTCDVSTSGTNKIITCSNSSHSNLTKGLTTSGKLDNLQFIPLSGASGKHSIKYKTWLGGNVEEEDPDNNEREMWFEVGSADFLKTLLVP